MFYLAKQMYRKITNITNYIIDIQLITIIKIHIFEYF